MPSDDPVVAVQQALARMTPIEDMSLCCYSHGGGRLASPCDWEKLPNRADGGELIADFYDEVNRDGFMVLRNHAEALLAEIERLRVENAALRSDMMGCVPPSTLQRLERENAALRAQLAAANDVLAIIDRLLTAAREGGRERRCLRRQIIHLKTLLKNSSPT